MCKWRQMALKLYNKLSQWVYNLKPSIFFPTTNMKGTFFQIRVQSLCSNQTENKLEIRGPPLAKAFDLQGNPTKVSCFDIFSFVLD